MSFKRENDDMETLAWLEELASKSDLSEEEFEEEIANLVDIHKEAENSFEARQIKFRQEKAQDNFNTGVGSFKRFE